MTNTDKNIPQATGGERISRDLAKAQQRRDTRVSEMSEDIEAAMAPGLASASPACPSGLSPQATGGERISKDFAKSLEIMAPAGNFECLMAAIQGGADSVYFGVEKLNMRSHSANNFKMTDLKEIVRICSGYGVKTYLTLNIVLYNEDIEDMKRTLEAAKEAGVTAVIASDMAAIMYARQIGVEVHISTQLSISNAEALRFYAQFADVIVLARELNLGQVKEIKAVIDRDNICGPSGRRVEIEMFAHGALCMAISGKCYLSLHEYGASANRGSCYQLCRRAYKVEDRETGMQLEIDNKYIMSPKDLCTIEFMDKIIDAGVTVFKIEGRARSAEYVKRVASCYRRAADAVCNGTYTPELGTAMKKELEEVFNRGFWDGYYQGARLGEWCDVYGSTSTRKKVYCGKITNWFGKLGVAEILVESNTLKVGDKILIIGPTSGCVEYTVPEIRVDLKPVQEASKGTYCSIPVNWSEVVPGAREEAMSLCGDGCNEQACRAIEENRLRRSDKVYIWEKEQ